MPRFKTFWKCFAINFLTHEMQVMVMLFVKTKFGVSLLRVTLSNFEELNILSVSYMF